MTMKTLRVAIIGASGYTGADLIRLLLLHPHVDIAFLGASRKAGMALDDVFPQFVAADLPVLQTVDAVNWAEEAFDVIFCALPHTASQKLVKTIRAACGSVIIDLSADFRLRDPAAYTEWYGEAHLAPELQPSATYGLSEWYCDALKSANLIACPGCFPTAALLALIPLVRAGLVDPLRLIIDAKTGITGAGRALKENLLFTEMAEGMNPYGLGHHRHMSEIEQEVAKAAGLGDVRVSFTPHHIPVNRGELLTIYVELENAGSLKSIVDCWQQAYTSAPFVHILQGGKVPATRMVRGSNHVVMAAFEDRIAGRAILSVALDNLVKGSSGQAIQNMNLRFGLDETTALRQAPLFP